MDSNSDNEEVNYEMENTLQQEFKNYILDNKVTLKLDKENINDELNIILTEIYRKHLYKTIDRVSEKFTFSFNTFKKNLEKDHDYYTNLIIVKCLVDRMSDHFAEFRDNIIYNKSYSNLRSNFNSLMALPRGSKRDCLRDSIITKFQSKISALFEDISLVYKTVMKSSGDIEFIFKHSFQVISREKSVSVIVIKVG